MKAIVLVPPLISVKHQIVEVNKKLERLEERLILEEINLGLYTKYSEKIKLERLEMEKGLLKTAKRVSNLQQCVKRALEFTSKLPTVWRFLPYKDKQIFQKKNKCLRKSAKSTGKLNNLQTIKMPTFIFLFHLVNTLNKRIKITEMNVCLSIFAGFKCRRAHKYFSLFSITF